MRPSRTGCGCALPKVSFSASCACFSFACTSAASSSACSCVTTPRSTSSRRILLADGRVLGDRGREQRLRVRGLVLLVVSVPAVADEVDDDVVAEAAAIREREPDRRDRRLRVVGVDVDDRDVEALREVARVARRAAALGVGREPDLVVRDQVKRAAGRVAVERLEVQRLRHLALARERRVAVDEHRRARRPGRGSRRRPSGRSAPRGRGPRPPGRPPRDGWGSTPA